MLGTYCNAPFVEFAAWMTSLVQLSTWLLLSRDHRTSGTDSDRLMCLPAALNKFGYCTATVLRRLNGLCLGRSAQFQASIHGVSSNIAFLDARICGSTASHVLQAVDKYAVWQSWVEDTPLVEDVARKAEESQRASRMSLVRLGGRSLSLLDERRYAQFPPCCCYHPRRFPGSFSELFHLSTPWCN